MFLNTEACAEPFNAASIRLPFEGGVATSSYDLSKWTDYEIVRVFRHDNVVSCEEAAAARGVDLGTELKSIVLVSPGGFVAVHCPADKKLDSKAIRRALGTKNLRFANEAELASQGLARGLVNPPACHFCSTQLVCDSLFTKEFVTTNAGEFDVGVAFPVNDLLNLPEYVCGRFSK